MKYNIILKNLLLALRVSDCQFLLYGGKVAVGPVTSYHLTGCVMYVGGREALRELNRFMLECLQEDQQYLANDILLQHVNEMVLLAAFFLLLPPIFVHPFVETRFVETETYVLACRWHGSDPRQCGELDCA